MIEASFDTKEQMGFGLWQKNFSFVKYHENIFQDIALQRLLRSKIDQIMYLWLPLNCVEPDSTEWWISQIIIQIELLVKKKIIIIEQTPYGNIYHTTLNKDFPT